MTPGFLTLALAAASEVYISRTEDPQGAELVMSDQAGVIASISLHRAGTVWEARVEAEKEGVSLLGQDPRFTRERYRQVLDGRYSLPFRKPDGRLRAFRDRVGGVVRFAWGFTETVAGKVKSGWIELAPLPDPFQSDVTAQGSEGSLSVTKIPLRDKDDRQAGFKVSKRPFHWSGAFGDAIVVTFDDAFAWRSQDIKLAFWSEAAWTPFWVMSPKAMQGYEFIETWGGGAKGCFEPMSDRVNRWASAEVVEDSSVRKIIRWRYALVNPDYVPWGAGLGSKQLPEAEEEWTILPEGTIHRVQRFWPSLDAAEPQHSLGLQLAEADVVFAADALPEEVLPAQALTAFGPGGQRVKATYPRQGQPQRPKVGDWQRFGYATHYKERGLPDAFIGFADAGLDSSLDWPGTWHEERFWRFSHFPFNHEPFVYETNSQHEGRGVITHTCLAYVGDARRRDWKDSFKVDGRGRKFREWASLIGMEPKGRIAAMDLRLKEWQEGARWEKLVTGAKAKWVPGRGELVISDPVLKITLKDGGAVRPTLSLPAKFVVRGISLNGRALVLNRDWRTASAGGRRLVWFSPRLVPGVAVIQ